MEWIVERHQLVESTMDLAAERARAGAPAGLVIVADEQRSGRGQRGRRWDAPAGSSLLCTVIARPDLPPQELTVLPAEIAMSVGRAVSRSFGVQCGVKPPNDVMVAGRKLAGILCQSATVGDSITFALIGIGLNVNIEPERLPARNATSLMIETGSSQCISHVLEDLLEDLACCRWFLPSDFLVTESAI